MTYGAREARRDMLIAIVCLVVLLLGVLMKLGLLETLMALLTAVIGYFISVAHSFVLGADEENTDA